MHSQTTAEFPLQVLFSKANFRDRFLKFTLSYVMHAKRNILFLKNQSVLKIIFFCKFFLSPASTIQSLTSKISVKQVNVFTALSIWFLRLLFLFFSSSELCAWFLLDLQLCNLQCCYPPTHSIRNTYSNKLDLQAWDLREKQTAETPFLIWLLFYIPTAWPQCVTNAGFTLGPRRQNGSPVSPNAIAPLRAAPACSPGPRWLPLPWALPPPPPQRVAGAREVPGDAGPVASAKESTFEILNKSPVFSSLS